MSNYAIVFEIYLFKKFAAVLQRHENHKKGVSTTLMPFFSKL